MRTSFFAFIIFLNIGICRAQQDIRIQKPAQIENTSRKQASLRDVFNQLQTSPLVLGKKLKDKDLKICLLLPYKSSRAFAFIQENIEPNELKSKPRLLPADIKNVLDF
ncbi:MAG: hypothetical protein NZ522_04295, partial [Chitinophagales bacterium]|nr:hypothetical protein [Chitinophagales bacterium]